MRAAQLDAGLGAEHSFFVFCRLFFALSQAFMAVLFLSIASFDALKAEFTASSAAFSFATSASRAAFSDLVVVLMFVFAAVRLLFASASSLVDRAISPFGPVQSDGGGGGAAAAVAARSRSGVSVPKRGGRRQRR